ncbi:MAG: AAA family ATPase [Verrucomicrobiota bacterium]
MYETYYHMQSKAFPAQPTPSVFFESRIHQGAFHYLTAGIEEHEPFLLLLGRYGMGKTLLCLRLLRYLRKEEHPFLNIPTPIVSYRELLEHILHSWGVTPLGDSDEALQTQLFHYMDRHLTPGRYFSVILDEVQDYQLSTLAKIRMLSNYNCDGFYPFQFIFFGHPDVLELLNTPPLASLQQRIRRRYTLTPFTFEETREYIYYRLLESGARGSPYFPDDTLRVIHARSEGIPRLINNLCDTCLLFGASKALSEIDRQTALDAADTLGLPAPKSASDAAEEDNDTSTGTLIDESVDEDESPVDEQSAASPAEVPDKDDNDTVAQDQREKPAEHSLWLVGRLLPPWAWRTIGALVIFLLGWILALRMSRLILPDAPPSNQPAQDQHRQPENNHSSARTQKAEQSTIDHEQNQPQAEPASDSTPTNQRRQTDQPRSTSDHPMLGTSSRRNATIDSSTDTAASSTRQGLLGYLGENSANLDYSPQESNKLAETIIDPILQNQETQETLQPATRKQDADDEETTTEANADSYPFSLQLRTTNERRQAAEILWRLREQGVPKLYIGRVRSQDATSAWAVLQGYYHNESQARAAKERLQLNDATPAETPFAVQIPVANTNGDTIQKYLREAGFWPYSITHPTKGERLLVGAFETRELAENWKQEMETRGFEAQTVSR